MNPAYWLLFGLWSPEPHTARAVPSRPEPATPRRRLPPQCQSSNDPDPGERATRFMAIQIQALPRTASHGNGNPAAFYSFAAGVYQSCAWAIPELNGHDRIPSPAELASLMPNDPAAAANVAAAIAAAPTWHSVRGRAECEKWLTRRRYDPRALLQSLSI